jgi:hypothetical protein
MNAQIIEGVLIQILKPESGVSKAGKNWSSQSFVIETLDEKFPKKICLILFGDKASLLNGITEGDQVSVSYNIESREANGRWFTSINAWKIEKLNQGSQTTGTPNNFETTGSGLLPKSEMAWTDKDKQQPEEDENSDLPF